MSAELASLGVSLVGPTREMAYLRAGGVHAQLAGTAAHLVLDLELRTLQVRCCELVRAAASLCACLRACAHICGFVSAGQC